MNPDDYDLSTSDGCRRALTRALFDAVNEAKAECLAQMQREQAAEARVPRPIRRRTFVPGEHDVAHERLFANYFAENPRWGPNVFHRRFRMSRDLFLRIVHTLEGRDEYFQYREDGIGRPGLMPLQKCTVAIRQLAYGTTADMFDEYLNVGDTTGRECLKTFWVAVRPFEFTVNGRTHHMGYYLADGIHPRCPVFLKTITCPIGRGKSCLRQSRSPRGRIWSGHLGVLQSRWAIVKGPVRFWYKDVIADVMYACIIMHNMIVEQERGHVTNWVDDEAGSSSSTATSPVTRGLPTGFGAVLQRQASMRNQQDHTQLMTDMIEEVWTRNRRR
ncbi:uncharacterized protein LOC125193396 [Salvia hispanica]|uniref:uncharacterized protein LOC125193396 n=1 Tax=Salvia hispanica TaxID=49212 RepID=UPI00200982D9|nr:uncharacterized protein LOC125193396 [Salvia hispanica]